ncbi:probable E3 ubiquitin-protein ligase RHA4A [Cajanus cajan]|nr:probable E3 ubiquitin-protein ligase RHA4A [Cajanus cajan]XP_020213850.1 probable E3 ubiquitin-protein ligase RHA4A [Cajanus cajan]
MNVMSVPEAATSPPPHLYPQELQLKLYQAFIFSIPILFSIILFLLFYLFYLKRRASSLSSSSPQLLPRTIANPPRYHSSPCRLDLTLQFLDKLPRILFDEDLLARDSICCVCLGEFEVKEEVVEIPYCKHVFHLDCIHHWLQSNSTCPLCRCSIIPTTKFLNPAPPINIISDPPQQHGAIILDSPLQILSLPPHPQDHELGDSSNAANLPRE